MDQPGVGWWVAVGGGGGVVFAVPEGHVRGGGQLAVVWVGDASLDVVPQVAVDPRPYFPRHGVDWGGAGLGVAHVGLA